MSQRILRDKPRAKLIPLRTEDDLRGIFGWAYLPESNEKTMTLKQFQARRKRNRLARKNRKRRGVR